MEWNVKSPLQWDWENQGLFSGRESEISISRHTQGVAWREEGVTIGNGSVYPVAGAVLSGSELGDASSRSFISPSTNSSSKAGAETSVFNFEAAEGLPKGLNKKKDLARVEDTGTSPVVAPNVSLGEPLIGLKLGKRTYFEDVCGGSNMKNSASLTSPVAPSTAAVKKIRVSHQSIPNFRCQVEGCNFDLSGAKDYHRKHRVCESHSKCPKVVIAGQERRFCQQCSRFHDLSEFDQKKRSCRRRLSDHNARRRKPQTDTISFASSRLSSSFYDDRQQMDFLLARAPFSLMRPTGSSTFGESDGFSLTHAKGSWIKSTKAGRIDGHLQFSSSEFGNSAHTLPHDLDKILPFKGTTGAVFSEGMEASVPASNLHGTPDLRRALSLLSTDSWGSVNSGQSSLAHFVNTSQTGVTVHPSMHTASTTPGGWQDQQMLPQQARVLSSDLHNNGGRYQEFQLSKAPYETSFNSDQIISKSDGHFLQFKT